MATADIRTKDLAMFLRRMPFLTQPTDSVATSAAVDEND